MVDVYKPHISGVTNYVSLNKRFIEALGHEVYVFTFGDLNYPDDESNIIRSPGLPFLETGIYIGLRYSGYARKLANTMDVMHVHHPFFSGALALRSFRPRGIPIIFTNHTRYDLYAQAYLPSGPDLIGEAAIQAYLPFFCRACDLVIAPSPGMREILVRFGIDSPIDVVPNGVDLEPFQKPENVLNRKELGYQNGHVIFVYAGRLGPEKNLPFLLRAFNGVAAAYDQTRLLVMGDGPERENLQDIVNRMDLADKVRFTGMIPYHQLPSYLTIADIFVTASVTEVHPLSVIEAMAAGLPVLGIQSPGVGDTVKDGITGLLSPSADLAAFTALMSRLVTNYQERQSMSLNARKESELYSIERTTKMMLERYQEISSQANRRRNDFRARLLRTWDGLRK